MKTIKEGSFNLEANELNPAEIHSILTKVFQKGGHPMPICICGKPGCIAEGTIIRGYWKGNNKYHNGRNTIDGIYKCQHGIKTKGSYQRKSSVFMVRSYNEATKEIEDVPVTSTYSGKKQCYKLETVGGYSTEMTADHEVLTERGWVRCDNLTTNDVVFVYPKVLSKAVKTGHTKSRQTCVKYHPTGSKKIISGCVYYSKNRHIIEYEATRNGMSYKEFVNLLNNYNGEKLYFVPKGKEVHHKDGNRANNSLDNVLVLTKQEHAKLHMKLDGKFGHMGTYTPQKQQVKSVSKTTIKDTYDLSCLENHNFFANNILVHNCGKSQIVQQVCRNFGVSYENGNYHEIRASMVVDSSDLTGLPCVMKKVRNNTQGTEEFDPSTIYSRPEQLPVDHAGLSESERNKLHVIFFDEINRSSDPSIMNAIFQVTTEFKIGAHKLLPNVIILLALNPEAEGYLVNSMDPALINRLCFLFMNTSFPVWKEYAQAHNVHDGVISFLESHRDKLSHDGIIRTDGADKRFPTPRAWENVSRMIDTLELNFNDTDKQAQDMCYKVIAGIVGEHSALDFCTYMRTSHNALPIPGSEIVEKYLTSKTLQDRIRAVDSKGIRLYDTTKVQQTLQGVVDIVRKEKDKMTNQRLTNVLAFMVDIPVEQSMSFQNLLTTDIGSDFTNWFFTTVSSDKNLSALWKTLQDNTKKYSANRKASKI